MRPELLESKLLRLESFDATVLADVMEHDILPRQREVNDAVAQALLRDGHEPELVEECRARYDEEQLALIGKVKTLRGHQVRVTAENGHIIGIDAIVKEENAEGC